LRLKCSGSSEPNPSILSSIAWDLVGSQFAGWHQQYEKIYAGASFIVRNHSYRETAWSEFNQLVKSAMASYDRPVAAKPGGKVAAA
jgi:4-hydroxyphenylacetate 3-monooxygenase